MRLRPVSFLLRLILAVACLIAALGVLQFALKVVLRVPLLGVGIVAAIIWRRMCGRIGSGSEFGTARASSFIDLARHGLLGEDGLIMGRAGWAKPPSLAELFAALVSPRVSSRVACGMFFGRLWCRNQIIRIRNYVHLATFSPTGGGKGVSAVIPNLLSYRRSVVATDPKGELFKITSEHRRRKFHHRNIRLDPFAIRGDGGDALNPLDFIDETAPDFLDQVRDLANALVVRTGQEQEPHWNDSAERVLTAFIAFVAACEPDRANRNLQTVRALISSRSAYTASVEVMQKTDGFVGVVQRLGHSLTWLADKELSSVLSVVQRHTAWMDSPAVSACLKQSSFDPRELRRGRMTVYLILPPERLVTLAPLMRVWLGTILRMLTRGAPDEKNPVLCMIDEAAHLGRLQILEDSLTLMRGYGIRIWLFFQSLGQLHKCYGENAQTILENIGTQLYFGTNNYQSADELSKRIGDATILLQSLNNTTSRSSPTGPSANGPQPGNVSTSNSITTSQTARRYLKPEEVLTLRADLALVFHKNLHVIAARLLRYYDAPEFRWGRTGGNRGIGLAGGVMAILIVLAGRALASLAPGVPPAQLREASYIAPAIYVGPITAPGMPVNDALVGLGEEDDSLFESCVKTLDSGWHWLTEPFSALLNSGVLWPPQDMSFHSETYRVPDRGSAYEVTPWWPPPPRWRQGDGY